MYHNRVEEPAACTSIATIVIIIVIMCDIRYILAEQTNGLIMHSQGGWLMDIERTVCALERKIFDLFTATGSCDLHVSCEKITPEWTGRFPLVARRVCPIRQPREACSVCGSAR